MTRTDPWLPLVLLALTGCAVSGSAPLEWKRMTFSMLEDYDRGDDLVEVARDFQVMRDLGIATWRGSFGWDDYEPEPGRFEAAWLHQFADLAALYGITLRPYLGYTPEWAARGGPDARAWNDPPKDLGAWSAFVARMAREMSAHGNVASYEIYNEQNTKLWWEGDVTDYVPVLAAAREAIATHHPAAAVVMGGLVWPDVEWLSSVCDAAPDAFDAAAVHAYPETWTGPGVTVETYLGADYAAFLEEARTACGGAEVWINETGFATTAGRSERDQANWWARAIATFAATPGVDHVGIYEVKDLPPGEAVIGDAPNYHLGILRTDRTPKLAYFALRKLLPLMSETRIAWSPAAARVSGPVHHRVFERSDGRRVVYVWRRGPGPASASIVLARPASRVIEHRLDGGSREVGPGELNGVELGEDVRVFELFP